MIKYVCKGGNHLQVSSERTSKIKNMILLVIDRCKNNLIKMYIVILLRNKN